MALGMLWQTGLAIMGVLAPWKHHVNHVRVDVVLRAVHVQVVVVPVAARVKPE